MDANKKENTGFALPPPQTASAQTEAASAGSAGSTGSMSASAASGNAASGTTASELEPAGNAGVVSDTSSRDMVIGGGILLVLFIAFFFAKNAFANMLVAKRVPPVKANAGGWWLFIFLASLSTCVVLAGINAAKFMTPLVLGPIAAVGIVALVLTVMSSRK